MAYNFSFRIDVSTDPSSFTLVDTSTGSDPDLTQRIIYLYQSNGQLLVPAITWPIADNTYTFTGLEQDVALNVRVEVSSSNPLPDPSTYTSSQLYAFIQYGQQFYLQLTQDQVATPNIIQDSNWYGNKMILKVEMDSAVQAIDEGAQLFAAQACITRYNYMLQNASYYW